MSNVELDEVIVIGQILVIYGDTAVAFKLEQEVVITFIAPFVIFKDLGLASLGRQVGRRPYLLTVKVTNIVIIVCVALVCLANIDILQLIIFISVINCKYQFAVIQIVCAIIILVVAKGAATNIGNTNNTDVRNILIELYGFGCECIVVIIRILIEENQCYFIIIRAIQIEIEYVVLTDIQRAQIVVIVLELIVIVVIIDIIRINCKDRINILIRGIRDQQAGISRRPSAKPLFFRVMVAVLGLVDEKVTLPDSMTSPSLSYARMYHLRMPVRSMLNLSVSPFLVVSIRFSALRNAESVLDRAIRSS